MPSLSHAFYRKRFDQLSEISISEERYGEHVTFVDSLLPLQAIPLLQIASRLESSYPVAESDA
jgi:hypothetical protein